MNTNDINMNKSLLELLIKRALLDSMEWITKRCHSAPQEPDYVAALSTRFTESMYHILRAVFPAMNFSITGAYCHQKPIVDIKMPKKPELGDLLLVYVDRDCDGNRMMNSLLLQAKISNSAQKRISSSELHQLELYKRWPEFTYLRAGRLNGEKRNIQPKTINDGAQYLLIDNNPLTNGLLGDANTFPMGCAIPDSILKIDDSFSNEIINFLKFKAGRTVDSEYYATNDDWSKMIWELLFITRAKCTKRKNAGITSMPRENTFVNFCTQNIRGHSLFDEMDFYNEGIQNIEESGGVSVILIESINNQKGEFDE